MGQSMKGFAWLTCCPLSFVVISISRPAFWSDLPSVSVFDERFASYFFDVCDSLIARAEVLQTLFLLSLIGVKFPRFLYV